MKYFKVQELVDKSTWEARGERSIQLIDKAIPMFLDNLREALGRPITINNWHIGGDFNWRGLRTPDSPWYSTYSQHSFGRGLDFDVKGMSAEEVRQWLIKNRNLEWVKCITFIEGGTNWVHVDIRGGTNEDLWLWDVNTNETEIFKKEV